MSVDGILGGRYRLEEVLGVGGMGRVLRGWDTVLDRPVAIKVLRFEVLDTDPVGTSIERFRREARVVAGFDHPAIVQVYDMGQDLLDGRMVHCLVMQLIAGTTLQDAQRTSRLPPGYLIRITMDILGALQHAHDRGVVHRDIKPANIMLTATGSAKVMDFGIAHLKGASNLLTATGNVVGTAAYLAPEQAQDSRRVDARSDVYSVGCMLYHLLTDQLPFPGETPWEILLGHQQRTYVPVSEAVPALGTVFDAVLARALAKNPDDRYASAKAMYTDLATIAPRYPAALDVMSTGDGMVPDALPLDMATLATPSQRLQNPTDESSPPTEYLPPRPAPDLATPPPATEPPPEPTESRRSWPSRRTALVALGGAALLAGAGVGAATLLGSDEKSDTTPVAGPPGSVLWKASAGSVVVLATPAVADGHVVIAGYDGTLYVLDARNGRSDWTATTDDRLRPSAVVAGGLAYVASWDRHVYAYDLATGDEQWSVSVEDQENSFPVALTVASGTVYFGTTDWFVYALDGATGAVLWRTLTYGAASAAPAVVDGVVYLGTEGSVYALDAATGTVRWKSLVGGLSWTAPAVSGDLVYLGNFDQNVYALDAATGAVRWTYATGGPVYSAPAVSGDLVFAGSYDKSVHALDAATGAIRWQTPTNGKIYSSPTVSGDTVYIGSWDGYLYALESASGTVRWKAPIGGPVWSSPTVADKVVYIGSADAKVYAMNV